MGSPPSNSVLFEFNFERDSISVASCSTGVSARYTANSRGRGTYMRGYVLKKSTLPLRYSSPLVFCSSMNVPRNGGRALAEHSRERTPDRQQFNRVDVVFLCGSIESRSLLGQDAERVQCDHDILPSEHGPRSLSECRA
jgi:hypothetical protein